MPDRFTADWWRLQFEGVCHTVNLLAREQGGYEARFAALWARIEEQEAAIKELSLKLGQVCERMDRAANVVAAMKKGKQDNGHA